MASFNENIDVVGSTGYGGVGHGMGGGWLLGGLIIFLLIFKDGFFGHRGGEEARGGDHGRERGWFPDESNFQLGRELDNHMCQMERDIHGEADKTRALITSNTIQELRDANLAKDMRIQTMESEAFTGARFGRLEAMVEALAVRMPHLEPQYIATRGMCLSERPTCGEARRGGCGDFN